MPYHTNQKKKMIKLKWLLVIKKNKKRELKPEEKELFKTHSKHHSKEHIAFMKKFIKDGKGCFSEAHKAASKSVGR